MPRIFLWRGLTKTHAERPFGYHAICEFLRKFRPGEAEPLEGGREFTLFTKPHRDPYCEVPVKRDPRQGSVMHEVILAFADDEGDLPSESAVESWHLSDGEK